MAGDLAGDATPRRAARLLDALVASYQRLTVGSQPRCRYLPTCSEYARDAWATHGAGRGSWLAVRRLGRCHPWGGHGYDPVPGVTRELEGAS